MTAPRSAALYTPEILALAVDLAEFPLNKTLPLHGEARSRVCGSRVELALSLDEAGRIAEIGARVSACAIGQAAAATFLRSARARDAGEIAVALSQLEEWLSAGGPPPDWPGVEGLASAREYPARHAAILLPWKAALAALSNPAMPD